MAGERVAVAIACLALQNASCLFWMPSRKFQWD